MEEAYSLPETFHADPADRIITATARLKKYTLLTADRKILSYPHVNAIW
jgi:PIN domain nuclease of toxin-antitoxin system